VLIQIPDPEHLDSSQDLSDEPLSTGLSNQIPAQTRKPQGDVRVHNERGEEKDHSIVSSNIPLDDASHHGRFILSPEQTTVLEMVRHRKNVFFTGSAGLLPTTSYVVTLE
jgi:hypothetical protein